MALITFAKPEKNFFPSSKFVIATNSSKDAPAQKALSPSDFKITTDTSSFLAIICNSLVNLSKS